ncbi:Sporulation domain protein [Magnetococcus marinus MC-1]|uniref:Sporulation domain protein n=1 Tax=Magnetococcus marinus (strain ATCC BAA-1437 / JCM 17883 / MC-1) TaxID=156889 RepID=A0L649_MAGMM|nr:SPOR domain-containing protein [Magnetococcus marinus]ABK43442.1 Sporulation domain protein [Magnetococcus marinus MC-1]
MSAYRHALGYMAIRQLSYLVLALGMLLVPMRSIAQEQPAFITNAYFADKLDVQENQVKPNALVSVLPASNPSMVGYFVMDVLLASKGKHLFEIDIIDEQRRKVADMAYDAVLAEDTEHIYTVVGSVAGAFPPGWLYFKVYDRFNGGPRIHISTFSIMARLNTADADTAMANAAVPSAPLKPTKPLASQPPMPAHTAPSPVVKAEIKPTPLPVAVPQPGLAPPAAPVTEPTAAVESTMAEPASDGRYVLIGGGDFGPEKAKAVLQQISDLGLPVQIETSARGQQVLSGPYSRIEAAEFARRFIVEQTGLESRIRTDGNPSVGAQAAAVTTPTANTPQPAADTTLGLFAPKVAVAAAMPRYVVALGSFGNVDNAQRLQHNLHKRQLPVSTEQVQGKNGQFTRVFVGPYSSRREAEVAMRSILAHFKISGVIQRWNPERLARLQPSSALPEPVPQAVLPEPVPQAVLPVTVRSEAPQTPMEPAKVARYAIQVVSYLEPAAADLMEKRLVELGLPVYQNRLQARGRQLYRVLVGPYQNRAQAEGVQGVVKDELGLQGSVIPFQQGDDAAATLSSTAAAAPAAVAPVGGTWQRAIVAPKPNSAPEPKAAVVATPLFSDTGRQDYTVYAGFFSNAENATRLRQRIEALQLPAFQRQVEVNNGVMNSVCAGPFATRGQAEAVVERLKKQIGLQRPIIRDATFSGRDGQGCGPGRSR